MPLDFSEVRGYSCIMATKDGDMDFLVLNPWQPHEVRLMQQHLANEHPGVEKPLLTFDTTACDECWRIAEKASNLSALLAPGEEITPQRVIDALNWAVDRDDRKREEVERKRINGRGVVYYSTDGRIIYA